MPGVTALAGLRILIVEDEAIVAMLIEDMLQALGCTVVKIAANLREGLAAAGDEAVALDGAVLDVNLGGEKVFPVAERLTARGVPFIFSTGYGTKGIADEFACAPVLAKPYGQDALGETLTAALRPAA